VSEPITWVKKDPHKENVFWPTAAMKERAWVSDESIYAEATADPEKFWAERAEELHWFKRWEEVYQFKPQAYKMVCRRQDQSLSQQPRSPH